MRRADRLFRIVQHLRGGRLLTASDLAETLEVSRRTIYRDIADLIGSGVPIDGEAGVGYIMREGYDLPPLMFTHDEIVALVAGARLIRAWGGISMAAAAEEAMAKINAVLPDSARSRAQAVHVHAFAMGDITAADRAMLDRLETAADQQITIAIRYRDEAGSTSQRNVRPLGLFFWGKVWTLIGWCELRSDFRMFRVDRMTDMAEGVRFRSERDKSLKHFFATERHKAR